MKNSVIAIICAVLLVVPILSLAKGKKSPNPNVSAQEHANENAKFKRSGEVFNSKVNKEKRAKKRAEKKARKAAQEKKKAEEAQDKGEGQVKMKF